jgi:lactoylglutathione lyase
MRKSIKCTLQIACIVLLSTIWIACDSASTDDSDVTSGEDSRGVLTGIVREAGLDIPLSDITVGLNNVETTTDQNGHFAFQEVPVGFRTIEINMAGFNTYSESINVEAGNNSVDVALLRKYSVHFDHANVLMNDVEQGATFYKDILALSEVESPWGTNSSVRVLSIGENQQLQAVKDLSFIPVTSAKNNHVAFSVKDFDATLNVLTGKGIGYGTFSGGFNGNAQVRPDGVKQIYLQDTSGNWVEINDALSSSQDSNSSYDHQGIYVRSLEQSGFFYRNILRLEEITSPWNDTSVTRFFSTGDTGELHLVPTNGEDIHTKQKREHITFNVDYFDSYLGFLALKGVEYGNYAGDMGQIDLRPDGVKQIYLQDPDGNWIEIIDAQY